MLRPLDVDGAASGRLGCLLFRVLDLLLNFLAVHINVARGFHCKFDMVALHHDDHDANVPADADGLAGFAFENEHCASWVG